MTNIGKHRSLLETILIDYRWIFVIFFLLPLSFLYDVALALRAKLIIKLGDPVWLHGKKLEKLRKKVSEEYHRNVRIQGQ